MKDKAEWMSRMNILKQQEKKERNIWKNKAKKWKIKCIDKPNRS